MADRAPPGSRSGRDWRSTSVDYAEIRPMVQRVRLVTAGGFLVLSFGSWAAGNPWVFVRLGAAALLAADAAIRLRFGRSAFPSLIVDAVLGSFLIGVGTGVDAALVAMLGYLVVAGVLLLPGIHALGLFTVGGGMIATRSLLLDAEPPATWGAAVVGWTDVTLALLGMALVLMAGESQIRRARHRREKALQAERRASDLKNEFVSMVSHELRTPLTNIAGFTIALKDGWRTLEPKEIDEFLTIVCTEADHLTTMVEDVLAIPRLEAGRLLLEATDFQLRAAAFKVAESVLPIGGAKSASVSVAGNIVVHADPNRVEQVLRNLLDNARKYGGDQVGVEAIPRGDAIVVVVADNGPGVPEAERDRIFERFEQMTRGDSRTDKGFGLGLAVTRRLVEAMGGEVWYEPGFPIGSRFCFTLPTAGTVTTERPRALQPSPPARRPQIREPESVLPREQA
jgi:signal transduction histidine kinase